MFFFLSNYKILNIINNIKILKKQTIRSLKIFANNYVHSYILHIQTFLIALSKMSLIWI